MRRRRRLRKVLPAQAGIMPLIASILAVCLVAGMMLSVFTISPVEQPNRAHRPAVQPTSQPASPRPSPSVSHSTRPASSPTGSASPR